VGRTGDEKQAPAVEEAGMDAEDAVAGMADTDRLTEEAVAVVVEAVDLLQLMHPWKLAKSTPSLLESSLVGERVSPRCLDS